MYSILECPPITNENGELLVMIHNSDEVGDVWSFGSGEMLESDEISSIPSLIKFDVEPFLGYQGAPNEFRDLGSCVMSKRLADALVTAGVDNIDFYPLLLTNTVTGQTYDYFVYNLVGKVALADLEKSQHFSYDNKLVTDVGFKDLVLDESKTHGLLMFRLAEDVSAILIHESVKKTIIDQGIDTLSFVKPDDYVQI